MNKQLEAIVQTRGHSRHKNEVSISFSKVAAGLSLKLIEQHRSCSKQNDRCPLLEGLFIVNHLDETVNA